MARALLSPANGLATPLRVCKCLRYFVRFVLFCTAANTQAEMFSINNIWSLARYAIISSNVFRRLCLYSMLEEGAGTMTLFAILFYRASKISMILRIYTANTQQTLTRTHTHTMTQQLYRPFRQQHLSDSFQFHFVLGWLFDYVQHLSTSKHGWSYSSQTKPKINKNTVVGE